MFVCLFVFLFFCMFAFISSLCCFGSYHGALKFGSSVATSSGTLQIKYHKFMLSVDSASLELIIGVFQFTTAHLDHKLRAFKYLLLFTLFTDPIYPIFPLILSWSYISHKKNIAATARNLM